MQAFKGTLTFYVICFWFISVYKVVLSLDHLLSLNFLLLQALSSKLRSMPSMTSSR